MIHAYMPQSGLVDEELYAPEPCPQVMGYAIGILCVANIRNVIPPGYVFNASTWNFPVLYRIVEETTNWKVMNAEAEGDEFSPRVRDALIAGAVELEKAGVRAISGGCGFFANFQKEVAAAVDIPVFLSSLSQIPIIRQGLKPGQKIGVMTAASDLLGTRTFSQVGVDDLSDIVIVGAQDCGEFKKVRGTTQVGHFNPARLEKDIANLAKQFIKDNPEIGIILLECAALPPFAWVIQNATNLPVFDFYTLIDWIYKSVVRRPFAGFY